MFEIEIRIIPRGWASHRLTLYEDGCFVHDEDYLYYTKREMLRDFKERTGVKGKHGVKITDLTRR